MAKADFVKQVEAMALSAEAREYFEQTFKVKRVNAKAAAKAVAIKQAIIEFFKGNEGSHDRVALANAVHNSGSLEESYTVNEKGDIAYNSFTAYANQLVAEGVLGKSEVKVGKAKRVAYHLVVAPKVDNFMELDF